MARPKKQLNKEIFEELCAIQCTKEEICLILRVSENTLSRMCEDEYGEGFCVIYKKLSANGKMSLRRAQMNLAKTNASMAIWLGKQYLGQKDAPNDIDDLQLSKLDDLINSVDRMAAR